METFPVKGQVQRRKRKNRVILLSKFDCYFEQVINKINKFYMKKKV